jgi:hypothetical protein
MQFGDFYYPSPVNEPVLNYAPGSAERLALKSALKTMKSEDVTVVFTQTVREHSQLPEQLSATTS